MLSCSRVRSIQSVGDLRAGLQMPMGVSVDDEMAGEVGVRAERMGPLGAVFLIDERGGVAELLEDGTEGGAIGYGGFGFDANLIAGSVYGLVGAGLAFVGDGAERAVLADAEDLFALAEVTGGSVV